MRYHFHPAVDLLVRLMLFVCLNYPQRIVVDTFRPAKVRRPKRTHVLNPDGTEKQRPGMVLVLMGDEACLNLKSAEPDAWFIVRIRKSVVDRFQSPIVSPHDAGKKGSVIV